MKCSLLWSSASTNNRYLYLILFIEFWWFYVFAMIEIELIETYLQFCSKPQTVVKPNVLEIVDAAHLDAFLANCDCKHESRNTVLLKVCSIYDFQKNKAVHFFNIFKFVNLNQNLCLFLLPTVQFLSLSSGCCYICYLRSLCFGYIHGFLNVLGSHATQTTSLSAV